MLFKHPDKKSKIKKACGTNTKQLLYLEYALCRPWLVFLPKANPTDQFIFIQWTKWLLSQNQLFGSFAPHESKWTKFPGPMGNANSSVHFDLLGRGVQPIVRGKSHWKSSRWFLPFFVPYWSIAVGCELSLRPEMRTYKNDVRLYCMGNL